MSVNTWAEVDELCLDVLSACDDGRERTIGQIDVYQPTTVIRVAVEQLVTAGHLHVRHGEIRTTYTITDAGRRHLAGAKQKVAV